MTNTDANLMLFNSDKTITKLKLWFTGIGSYYFFTWIYDYIVISFLIVYFGALTGGIIAIVLSMCLDIGTLKFYDWLKKDWLALETIKDISDKKGFVGKLFKFVHDKSTVVTVFVLSLALNAFVITTYMRRGAHKYNGLSERDWIIFISSSIIGNGYWILVFAGGITFLKESIKLFF